MNKYLISGLFAAAIVAAPMAAQAAELTRTVGQIYAQQKQLEGKHVQVSGEVVKVNNGIMRRNFIHVKDGTGKAADKTDDLLVTSKQTVNVGDKVKVTALVTLNRDFGMGYKYSLILEEAVITPIK